VASPKDTATSEVAVALKALVAPTVPELVAAHVAE